MDVSSIIEPLNHEQRDAVCTEAPHALVLAGAGSGKTRVLTHRVAWLHRVEHVPLRAMMVLTFTNKAANEMRRRLAQMLERPIRPLWVGTFHSVCHRILRVHHESAGLPRTFDILDSADQLSFVRRIIADLKLDTKEFEPKKIQSFINRNKEAGVRAGEMPPPEFNNRRTQVMRDLYTEYEKRCRAGAVVDFAELLLATVELFRDNNEVARQYREGFNTLLIDEFQDTNNLQYAWCRLLTQDGMRLFIVGDDDQAIYGWRGARPDNIQDLQKHFPDTMIYRLERNYRSTGTILDAANRLISHNDQRLGKNLWTEGNAGEPIVFYTAQDEREEAEFIADTVRHWHENNGRRLSEAAILYRSNMQSRALEEALRIHGTAYRIYGGLRFYERAEVKDAIAYLRLATETGSDTSFARIVNTPARGIGEATLARIRSASDDLGIGLWDAGRCLIDDDKLPARETKALKRFYKLIDDMRDAMRGRLLYERLSTAVYDSGLHAMYGNNKDPVKVSKRENLEELLNDAKLFEGNYAGELDGGDSGNDNDGGDNGDEVTTAFIARATLDAGERPEDDADAVQMMTLHASKGLEFPLVILAGLEEGLLPHALSLEEGNEEEERRLCYVGMTRACEHLVLARARQRYRYGRERTHSAESRFISELPEELLERRPLSEVRRPVGQRAQTVSSEEISGTADGQTPGMGDEGVRVGQRVRHQNFGEGVVTDYEGSGVAARARVKFPEHGEKWLVLSYAPMEVCK